MPFNNLSFGFFSSDVHVAMVLFLISSFICFQVEGLLDEEDFKTKVTRAEFDLLCEDLFKKVTKPIDDALKASEITMVCNMVKLHVMLMLCLLMLDN